MKTFDEWKKDRSQNDSDSSKILIVWLLVSIIIAAIAA